MSAGIAKSMAATVHHGGRQRSRTPHPRVRTAFEAGRRPPGVCLPDAPMRYRAREIPRGAASCSGPHRGGSGARRSLLELAVPVGVAAQKRAPTLRHPFPEGKGDPERVRQLLRLDRAGPELHARLLWGLAALPLIAVDAAG